MPRKPDLRYALIGDRYRAACRYYMIANRLKNTHRSKNSGYVGVELRVSKEDFIKWFMERDFRGCSVDRIDNSGHYELSNMQVIALKANIAKDKIRLNADGTRPCHDCKVNKAVSEFAVDKRRIHLGVSTRCKSCDSRRKRR